MARLRHRLEYGVVRLLLAVVHVLPTGCVYGLANGLAALYYRIGFGRRRIALDNLALAFPEMAPADRRRVARACYRSAATTAVEGMLVLTGRLVPERIRGMVDGEQWQRLSAVESTSKTGLLIITAHFGNWEMLSHYVGLRSPRLSNVVGRRTTNPLLEERLVQPLRERFGAQLIHKRRALMRLVRALKKGENVGLLIDQKSNRRDGVEVEFFGVPVLAPATPARLQIRHGVPVVPAFLVRTGNRSYRLEVADPVEWHDNGAPQEEQVRELTQKHQLEIETMIRAYPEQWFWMHDRWRRRH